MPDAGAVNSAVAGIGQTVNPQRTRKETIKLTNLVIPMVDQAGVVAFGSVKLYDFAKGRMKISSAVLDLTLQRTTAGINTLWDGDISLGTVAAAGDATLTSTEANILASTFTPQAVGGVSTVAGANTTSQILDGSATALDVYLNLLVDDTDHDITTTPGNIVANGTVVLIYENISAD